nr:MAG TPA: restriction alleviation protein [Caudoviricetes sp.]
MVERIQLTYSTSRLFYQLNHIKPCRLCPQYLSRRDYSHIGF